MTFKHTKFEDSSTMRSLVKLAQEKGWVKDEPLQKTAASKLDLTPSENLTENVLKLCAGLCAAGFEKQADEVEAKFVQYKRAGNLYEVGSEKGEDIVHAAHPKGSHKMEDIDSKEATFEDILDKHMQMMNVVEKKPTGKYANVNDIFKAVRVVLAEQDANTGLTKPVIDYIMGFFRNIDEDLQSGWNYITGTSSEGVLAYNRLKAMFINHINNGTINNDSLSQLKDMVHDAITGFSTRELSKLFYISDATDNIIFQLKSLKNYIQDSVYDDHKGLMASEKQESQNDPNLIKIQDLLKKLQGFTLYNNVASNQKAMKWVSDQTYYLTNKIKPRYEKAVQLGDDGAKQDVLSDLSKEEGYINDFNARLHPSA